MTKKIIYLFSAVYVVVSFLCACRTHTADLYDGFRTPPDTARPGVYWYFMDGNLSREGMTKDLEAMKQGGVGYVVFLEVNVGVPRGKVDFMSEQWLDLFGHAVNECRRLGIRMTLGIGPGWTGSGGPWVTGAESMKHLVASTVEVTGGSLQKIPIAKAAPRNPFFGSADFSPEMNKKWSEYYEDVALLAFPTPQGNARIENTDEKALYYRAPYSSMPGVKQYLPTAAQYAPTLAGEAVDPAGIVDLSTLPIVNDSVAWTVPEGRWTILRLGSRNIGAVTRPAPTPGLGMEADKFDTVAMANHLKMFTDKLFAKIGQKPSNDAGGLKMLHMDSWEMGAQNWTGHMREEFKKRRGYDPQPYYPVYQGYIVKDRETSERFLWDLRLTSQELILENHVRFVKAYAHRYGLGLSIEPYDMNPTADLELGVAADVPMCEFWCVGVNGFNTAFSAMEGSSAAHLIGQPVVPSEAFTSHLDAWRPHPATMKNQTDWAFAAGINRLTYHTFQHQSLPDSLRPGMTMGPYGVHWDRNQTWWPMASGYHTYVSRCQYMLQQGRTVADILYLTPEGAPHAFRAPVSALDSADTYLPDRKGYNFDGCPPSMLYKASVKDGVIHFPSGAQYRVLVLPEVPTMTPELLSKIKELIAQGATVVGNAPQKSPSLSGYPACDQKVAALAREIWGGDAQSEHRLGKGRIICNRDSVDNLYQPYPKTAALLNTMQLKEDFVSSVPHVRYTHRTNGRYEIYFVANRTDSAFTTQGLFRVSGVVPEVWNPMNGKRRTLPQYEECGAQTRIPLHFAPHESYFVVFDRNHVATKDKKASSTEVNYVEPQELMQVVSPWQVSFDPKWGGPSVVVFDRLIDWTESSDPGIKFYSGTAVYTTVFDLPKSQPMSKGRYYLDLGDVRNMARVALNGRPLGIMWTKPWLVDITDMVKHSENRVRIEVVNLWTNRLIGDEQRPDDGCQNGQWPEWLTKGEPRTSGRYTFTTYKHYQADSPLSPSGLLGPVRILWTK